MLTFSAKPTDTLIKDYYAVFAQYGHLNVEHESTVRFAFQSVLRRYSKKMDCTLVPAIVKALPVLQISLTKGGAGQ